MNSPQPKTIYKLSNGHQYKTDDCGGHLIAAMFQGAGEAINLVPMNGKLNGSGGKWYQMERQWRMALQENKKVEVNIKPIYLNNDKRPRTFEIRFSIDGELVERILKNTPTGE